MKNILEYLEKTAEKNPHKIGFTDEKSEVSFLQLMNNSKKIAGSLKSLSKNSPVAIMIERSVECIESMFAAVYAGCFYTVIDIHSPLSRINEIFQALKPGAVITDNDSLSIAGQLKYLSEEDSENIQLILYEEAVKDHIDNKFLSRARLYMIDSDPLYILFTSGSSGTPKGTVLSHRSVINYIEWVSEEFSFSQTTIFGSQTPLYFSMSVTDLFSTLKCGGTYTLIPKMMFSFPVKLIEYMNSRQINTIYWVPSALAIASNWNLFQYEKLMYIEKVLFAGEVMPVKHLNYWIRFLPKCVYANLFGPTETTDICTFYVIDREFKDDEQLPIGKPCNNCDVFLLTEDGRMAAPGEEGEIAVRGSFLASGYYNDPEKTEAAFPQNPLNKSYPERIYKTGDLARLNEKGEYIYISRKDFQIKRMGYRIELGEIEAAAISLKGIKSAAAVCDSESGRILLICEGKVKEPEQISETLKKKIPSYMLPDEIIKIKVMPYNANGKIDRAKLKKYITTDRKMR